MTKKQLIANLFVDSGLSRADCEKVIDTLAKFTAETLADRNKVILPGIGSLSIQATKERIGRNPATGEMMTIPAGKRIKFKPLQGLKNAVY